MADRDCQGNDLGAVYHTSSTHSNDHAHPFLSAKVSSSIYILNDGIGLDPIEFNHLYSRIQQALQRLPVGSVPFNRAFAINQKCFIPICRCKATQFLYNTCPEV